MSAYRLFSPFPIHVAVSSPVPNPIPRSITRPMIPENPPKDAIHRLGGTEAAEDLRRALGKWFRKEAREYPWRKTRDPYSILVSELMLQQTQIATVLGRGYYDRWMRTFPDWASLAEAPEEAILKLWEGLGYYNRARNLQRTARIILRDHDGRFPDALSSALSLPGIGRYTAGAVLSFAYDMVVPLVDGNVARVLARLLALETPINSPEGLKTLWDWSGQLLDQRNPAIHNSALMELGQRICRPSRPECGNCPVAAHCLSHRHDLTSELPNKTKSQTVSKRVEHVLLSERHGRIHLCPESGSRRQGLWRLPEISGEEAADLPELLRFEYTITRYRVTLIVHEAPAGWQPNENAPGQGAWFRRDAPGEFPPLGSPYRRALEQYAGLA
jgi:A/G-specific adenine glycosylase